jgi:hypothetical protein
MLPGNLRAGASYVYHWNCWIISPSARLAAPSLHAQLLRLCQELSEEVCLVEGLGCLGMKFQVAIYMCYVVLCRQNAVLWCYA